MRTEKNFVPRYYPTWYVVANRSEAKVFRLVDKGRSLELVHAIPHPEGRLQGIEIDTDQPGRSFGPGHPGRHAYTQRESPTERLSELFAADIARFLGQARNNEFYERLVLVAEPNFLGLIRSHLSPALKKCVAGVLTKDLVNYSEQEIHRHLGTLLKVPYQEELIPYDQTA